MKILIWGTGKIAARYIQYGFFCGHEIVGFVDSFKSDDTFKGKPVYKPTQIEELNYNYLVICVLNSNEEILKTCINENVNLKKVIFINSDAGFGTVSDKYTKLLPSEDEINDFMPVLCMNIKERREQHGYMRENYTRNQFHDEALISCVGDTHVVAWIPVELLFSECAEDNVLDNFTEEWKVQNKEWENHPLVCFKPYESLYRFLMRGEEFPSVYCEWWQRLFTSRGMNSGLSDEELIEKRFREFMIMQGELNKGMDFFIHHPSVGHWNNRGYFNLLDGHHRASFLYNSGLRKIPVRIPKGDYEAWLNTEVAKKVHSIIEKQDRFEFYQPVLNPYFMNLHPYREDYAKSRIHHILEYFGNTRFRNRTVLDVGACLGYFGQMFARMGARVTMIEHDPIHFELLSELNKLLYVDCEAVMQPFERYEPKQTFDIAIMLTVFYPYMEDEAVKMKFLENINKYVKGILIWESGDRAEYEKEQIMKYTKFKMFEHLCYTYATGKFRELGIFFANDDKSF